LPCHKKKLDDSSRLDVVETARVPDMLPSLFPSWSGYQQPGNPDVLHFIYRQCLLKLYLYGSCVQSKDCFSLDLNLKEKPASQK